MFDLITDTRERPLGERSLRSKLLAIAVHAIVVLALVVIPLLSVTNQLPPIAPTMMAFVAAEPAAPPPPPPPPPPSLPATAVARTEPVPTTGHLVAPFEAPREVQPEPASARDESTAGVLGGVEGGVPGGVVGGIVGGIVSNVTPPPPPPPPAPAAVARGPVHIGGQITAPALLRRVEPTYPEVAMTAHVTGIVILQATVNTDGCVESAKVLRSRHALLDKAAQEALMQWQYSPLVLNGIPTPFVLTVTFNFSVEK
jgi:periplasmic protein TonB